jgi:Ca2+-binding RTX toxin-like protein
MTPIRNSRQLLRRLRKRMSRRLPEALEARTLMTATVTTDKPDYAPGTTAWIAASNDSTPGLDFTVGESVRFHVTRNDGAPNDHPGHAPWQVTDGVGGFAAYTDGQGVTWSPDLDGAANGRVETNWFVAPHFNGAALRLTATGLASGAVATTFFTDSSLVNTTTTGSQLIGAETPRTVAFDASGNYVVVWSGNGAQTGQVDDSGVFAQRYDSSGNKVGGEILVNTTTTGTQSNPVISMADNGNFVVAWSTLNATTGWDVAARRFTVDGSGQIVALSTGGSTNEFVVSANSGVQRYPSVAMENDGAFMIAYRNDAGNRIDRRRYDASGTASLASAVVSLSTAVNPSVAITDDLRTVVVWYEPTGIYGQLYSAANAAVGTKFAIATSNVQLATTNYPQVAMDASGNFVALWRHSNLNQYTFQRYNAAGVAQGSPTDVMANGSVAVTNASLSMNGTGEFVVAWTESAGNQPVKFKQFNASGVATRSETVVDNASYSGAKLTSIAIDDSSRVVVSWSGSGNGDADGVFYSLYSTGSSSPAPTVSSVSPATVCTTGGVSVVITGTNLTGATAVSFGSTAATSFTVDSATQITAVVPAGVAGTVDVTVTTPDGTSSNSAADDLVYSTSSLSSLAVGSQTGSVTYGTAGSPTFAITATRASACDITGAAYTVTGLPAGVTGSLSPATGVNSSGNSSIPGSTLTLTVGATVNAGSYPFTVTLTNGSETVSNTGTLVISAKALTVTASARSKTYGDAVSFAGTEFTTSGLVNSDSVASVTLTSSGAAATASVGSYNIVPSAATGSGLSNYNITYANGSLTVGTKALTVTANNRTKTVGQTATFAGTEFTTSGLVNSDSMTSVTLTSTGAASGASIGTYNIVPSAAVGSGLTNYSISYTNGTLTVVGSDPTITGVSPSTVCTAGGVSVVISGANFTNASAVQFGATNATSFTVDNDGQITAVVPSGSAGTVDISVTTPVGTSANSAADNFTYSSSSITSLTLGSQSASLTYGAGTSVTFAVSATRASACNITGAVYSVSGLPAGVTGTLSPSSGVSASGNTSIPGSTLTLAVGATVNAGSYPFTVTLTNGAEVVSESGTLVVDAKALTITADSNSKTYGTAITFAGTEFTTSGLVNSDTVTSVTLTNTGAAATASVGTTNIVPSAAVGSGLSNYSITYTNGTMTVNAKALTITASDRTKTYGTAVTFAGTEFTTSGLVNSDAVSSVTLTSTGAAATGTAGTHNIVPSAATGTGLTNYSISYTNGTMTVNTKALTITASDRTKTYGTAVTFAGTEFTTSGLVNSDAVSSITLTSTGAAATASVGTSNIVPSAATGTGLANYSITYTNGTMTVNAKALTITASDRTKTYGTAVTFAGTEFTTSGLVNSDAVSSVTLTSSGDVATASAGTYNIVPSAATGTGLSNYSISYTNGTFTVNTKALTITADNQSKTEGNLFTFAGTEYTTSGLVNSDTVTSVTLTSTGEPTTATPGTYPIVASNAAGTGLSNYSITYTDGTMTVNPIGPLPDIIMTSASTSNATTLRVVYQIAGSDAPSFTLVVVRSSDSNYDGADTTLFTTTISLLADRTVGSHTKDFTIGSGAGQVALPGVGSADSTDDYNLIVVADPANLINEGDADPITTDNQVRFVGAYSNGSGTILVHGTAGNDTITVSSGRVTITGVNYTVPTSTATAMRFRAGPGDDTVTAGTFTNLIHGGPGTDTLNGGAASDSIYGDGGNDALNGNGGNDTFVFDLDESLGLDTLTDASGTDMIDFSPSTTQAASINLGSTLAQVVNANLTLTLASATQIENLTGGSLGDTLTGNTLNNVIFGGDGNDTLAGGTGNDTFSYNPDLASGTDTISDAGGNGDALDFSRGSTAVTVTVGATTAQTVNANIGLTLASASILENIIGSSGSDSLTGNALANSFTGGAGDDQLSGAGGNDSFLFDADSAIGSDTVLDTAGNDTLNFSATTTLGININLKTYETLIIAGDDFQTMNANHRLRVFFGTTIENVTGTETNDTITGGTGVNTLNGGGGDDILAGEAGNDIVQGGSGTDILSGNSGNDALQGGTGDDVYLFDADSALGSDSITETGTGTDILDFSATTTRTVTLNLATTTSQVVNANLSLSIPATSQVEGVIGTSLADTITGNALANILVGLGGNDVLSGAAARDLVIGGADADTLTGGDEEDLLIAGSTSYDAIAASLASILAKWTSAATYESRRTDLLAGTGAPALTAGTTVTADAAADTVSGNLGRDWFFAALAEVTDQAGDESLDAI